MTNMPKVPAETTSPEPMYRLRYPRSGFGFLTFCVQGGYRDPNAPPRFQAKARVQAEAPGEPTTGGEEEAAPQVSAQDKAKALRNRSIKETKKALDDLLFGLSSPPNVEGLFLLDEGVWPWQPEPVNLNPDFSYEEYWLLEDEPDLQKKVLSKLRASLAYYCPEGWFVYRWHLTKRDYRPRLYLRLLGHLGPGQDVAAATERLRGVWAKVTGGDPNLADVHLAHENSLAAFAAKPEWKTMPNLQHILKGGYVFGKFMKKNFPPMEYVEELVPESECRRRLAVLIRRYLEYKGLLDEQGQPKPEAENDLHYRQLRSNGSRSFMSRETGQEFLAAVVEMGLE